MFIFILKTGLAKFLDVQGTCWCRVPTMFINLFGLSDFLRKNNA